MGHHNCNARTHEMYYPADLTDLHVMVQYHYYDAVNAILSANAEADLEARLRDVVRVTPLVSALTGPPAAAELMVPSDVNPVYGRVNRAETVRVLCRWGVKVDAGAEMGAPTALCQACMKGWTDMAAILLQYGADLNYKCRYGDNTPLSLAIGAGHTSTAKMLTDAAAAEAEEDAYAALAYDEATVERKAAEVRRGAKR